MTLKRALKFTFLLLMVVALTGILAGGLQRLQAQDPQQGQAPKAGSVSKEDCAVCHEDVAKAFEKNPHDILEKSPHVKVANPCESCHGPGEAHASAGGDKNLIISFKGPAAKTYNDQCQACHRKDHEVTAFKGSMHARTGLSCSDCHGIHSAARFTKLLRQPVNTLCMDCHVQRRADFSKPHHHPVKEGAMVCVDCHQPHSGLERRQVRSHAGRVPCYKCHSQTEGPFVFEHAPLQIRECFACHEPHGSSNPKMLVRSTVRALCLECHSATGSRVLTSQPPAFHDVRLPRYQHCTTCHVKIHGSNVSPSFFR